jgi:ABC-2 type transport system permease protein
MRRFLALLGKELRGFFALPLVYFVSGVFLALAGYYFYTDLNAFITFGFGESIVEHLWQRLYNDVVRVVITVIPLITMRVYSEEKNLGTIELLYTAPLRDVEILLAKYLACMAVFGVMIGGTVLYPVLIYRIQPFDVSQLLAVYVGLLLLISALVAVGVFISSLTETQLIAAMFSYGALLLLWNLSWNEAAVPNDLLGLVSQLCAYDHFEPFARGVIDLKDVAYFLSITLFMSFLTMRSMESRQWRGRR